MLDTVKACVRHSQRIAVLTGAGVMVPNSPYSDWFCPGCRSRA